MDDTIPDPNPIPEIVYVKSEALAIGLQTSTHLGIRTRCVLKSTYLLYIQAKTSAENSLRMDTHWKFETLIYCGDKNIISSCN